MKQTKWFFIIIISLVLIYFILSTVASFYVNSHNGAYMFESIEECQKIYDLDYANTVITTYDTTDDDNSIKDLSYTSFFGANFKSDEISFEIFAYEFLGEEDAQLYYQNVSGKSGGINPRYSSSGGFFNRKIVVVYDNKAYLIRTSLLDELELSHALSEVFSIRVDWIK